MQSGIVDIATVSGSRQTMKSVNAQLKEYLPEGASLVSYSFEEGIPQKIYARALLVSGESFVRRLSERNAIWENSRIFIAERAVDVNCIQKLVTIGAESTVLIVNDSWAAAMDAVESLRKIGFSRWKYLVYSPELPIESVLKEKFDHVLSVGEPELVPEVFGPSYDIGTRIIAIQTIAEIWSFLGWPLDSIEKYINSYLEQVISMSQRAYDTSMRLDHTNQNLLELIDSIDDGMMVYNRRNQVVELCNAHLRKLSGLREDVSGRSLSDVIREQEIVSFLTSKPESGDSILAEWNGKSFVATRFLLEGDREVCTFRSVEKIEKDRSRVNRQLVHKGLYSKYSFDDIQGSSQEIRNTKQRAQRLAMTDLNILIEGESGTGKEMFAGAIHQASARRDKPYLAINFSSLNDSLMESELFGYEEGAFTGAKRGGKAGVFEMADGGTIFLDEIGDISPKMQVGLLRVLQEKEVMRIGDGRIRYVDVRVIAATNQNLLEKVRQGLFREDLYYRLKIGYLYIPPLRSRKEDIPYLAMRLLQQDGAENVKLSEDLMEWMQQQSWPGNVRELKNTLMYMNAMRNGMEIGMDDLPEQRPQQRNEQPCVRERNSEKDQLLCLIEEMLGDGILLGRRQLLAAAREKGICHTEYQLRKRLGGLEAEGKIIMGRGKVGIQLNEIEKS